MQTPTSLLLVVKAGHIGAAAAAETMLSWFEARGVSAAVIPADAAPEALRRSARGRDAVIVLGGDGTVVGVCRKLADEENAAPPYLGVNFGQVGFLAEVPPDAWEPWFKRLLAGELAVRSRILLAWTARRGGRTCGEGFAVNDVVVGRGSLARVLPVRVVIEEPCRLAAGEDRDPGHETGHVLSRDQAHAAGHADHDLGWIRSDGILVSTPQGTSAYALSAHGPLLHPDVRGLTLTPISPFFKSFPPMVLPPDCRIRLETAAQPATEAFLTVDGQEGMALAGGDMVIVRGAGIRLLQFTPPADSYFGRLRERGFIQTPRGEQPPASSSAASSPAVAGVNGALVERP